MLNIKVSNSIYKQLIFAYSIHHYRVVVDTYRHKYYDIIVVSTLPTNIKHLRQISSIYARLEINATFNKWNIHITFSKFTILLLMCFPLLLLLCYYSLIVMPFILLLNSVSVLINLLIYEYYFVNMFLLNLFITILSVTSPSKITCLKNNNKLFYKEP